ncbi:ammonium transporter [Sphingobium phenoxybenzoativorans]|uniref:Ammonium transporter n=1 Tax=Sphingobium phenoxybenzoativorans TaxID=1592790 RepID=A0A975PZZ8_9SPHN|nr:ammonium transporter [Sphingobium phenoxybenzoativorans]QUT04254.1 ammonium transporter [Sphingobium phenoxybenzoativorans]
MRLVLPVLALIALAFPAPAMAQVQVADSGDTAWMLICTALMLFAAIPGLALRFAGAVPARDASAAMARMVIAAAIAALLWAAAGNMLAYAPGPLWFGDLRHVSPQDMAALRPGMTIPEIAFLFFQLSVASMACGLLTGAFGGYRLLPVTLLVMLWLLLVYTPVVRAVSAGGWLAQAGVVDFSSALALHLATGVSALTAAVMRGLRHPADDHAPGAPVLGLTGCALVWLGSLGLSGGWTFGATADGIAAILNTHLAACAAALGWAVMERVRTGHATAGGMGCGALAGLAAISASAGFTDMPGAILTGLCAGVLGQFASATARLLRAWDPANIFAVHAVGGATGALMLALVNSRSPVDVRLVNQAVGVGAVILWSAAVTALLTLPLLLLKPARSESGHSP